jgi:NitT/TauT family transport system permease protein
MIAWSNKFKFENVEGGDVPSSPILYLLRNSSALALLRERTFKPISAHFYLRFAKRPRDKMSSVPNMKLNMRHTNGAEGRNLLISAGATFLRVNAALLIAAAWTIPAGVAIGSNPKLSRFAQPFTHIAASMPATALFPVLLLALINFGGGLGIASILLMLLGTQWYILFNVIAGASAIPSDLKEAAHIFHFGRIQRWRTVIRPGIFPYLITGLVTASGGAWNASIVANTSTLRIM